MRKHFIIVFISTVFIFSGCTPAMMVGLRGDFYDSRISESKDEFEVISTTFVNLQTGSFSQMAKMALCRFN